MVAWDRIDSTVITAVSNYMLKVWSATSGQLLHVLSVSSQNILILQILWDVEKTSRSRQFSLRVSTAFFRDMMMKYTYWKPTPSTPALCCLQAMMATFTSGT